MRIKDITDLCGKLLTTFDTDLLKIAALKQLALSQLTIKAASCVELKTDAIFANAAHKHCTQMFDDQAVSAGFTACELDKALCAIRVAGQAALHLSIITNPIPDGIKQASGELLSQLMYGGGHKGVKTQPASFMNRHPQPWGTFEPQHPPSQPTSENF